MDETTRSKAILDAVGGAANISNATHCATRLRLAIKNPDIVNEEQLKSISGVLGLAKNLKQYQIVIGPGVESQYVNFIKTGELPDGGAVDDEDVDSSPVSNANRKGIKGLLLRFTDFIAAAFLPCLPIIVAGGMISAVMVICTTYLGLSTKSGAYVIWNSIYNAAFFFLPIYVGYNAAKRMKMEPMLGSLLGGVLVSTDINNVKGLDFFNLPVTQSAYNGTVLPVIFSVVFASFVYKFFNKWTPTQVKFFVVPLATMIIVVPIMVLVLGPIGTWAGDLLGISLAWLNQHLGWFSVGIMGLISPLIIFTGTGAGTYPAILAAFTSNGYEAFIMPAMLAANLAVGGAALAVATMMKSKVDKGMAFSTGLTAVFGITEPAIFGVHARFRTSFVAAMAGGAIGGLFAGAVHLKEFAFASPGVASIIAFVSPDGSITNILLAIATMMIGFASGFIITRVLGIKVEKGGNK